MSSVFASRFSPRAADIAAFMWEEVTYTPHNGAGGPVQGGVVREPIEVLSDTRGAAVAARSIWLLKSDVTTLTLNGDSVEFVDRGTLQTYKLAAVLVDAPTMYHLELRG